MVEIRRAHNGGRPSCCALMPTVAALPTPPQPSRLANARGHERIQQARQLTNSVAKNASGDRNTRDDKMPSRQIINHGAPRKPNGENNFRLLSPKTRFATNCVATEWMGLEKTGQDHRIAWINRIIVGQLTLGSLTRHPVGPLPSCHPVKKTERHHVSSTSIPSNASSTPAGSSALVAS